LALTIVLFALALSVIRELSDSALTPTALIVAGGMFHVTAAVFPARAIGLDVCMVAIHGVVPAAISHLVLVLPKGRQLASRVPGVVVLLYSVAFALIVFEVRMLMRDSRLWELPDRMLGSWSLAGALALVGSCYFMVIEADTARERRIARFVMVASVAMSGGIVLASIGAGAALPGAPRQTMMVVLIAVLAGVALIASWHTPSEMPRILRWVTSYVLYTACVSVLVYLIVLIGGGRNHWPWSQLDPAMLVGVVFVGLVLVDYLRRVSWGIAESWVSPWAPRLEGARRSHSIGVGVLGSADSVMEQLVRSVARGVDLPKITGYLSVRSGAWRLAIANGEPFEAKFLDGATAVLDDAAGNERGLKDVVHLPDVTGQEEGDLERLRGGGILAICGLRGRDGYRGVVLLGRRNPRQLLSSDHLHFLEQIVSQSSLAVEKADLEHEIVAATRMVGLGHAAAGLAHDLYRPLSEILIESRNLANQRSFGSECPNLASIQDLACECMNRLGDFVCKGRRVSAAGDAVVDLSVVLQSAVDRLRKLNPKARVVLRDSSDRPIVEDPASLQRMFENVIENAIQWSMEGDPVEVVAIEFAGYAVVRIIDCGSGIHPDDRECVFDPFFSRRSGSGLGLTVSREIVRALGGSLEIESEPDLGTKVIVRVPIRSSEAQ
jgi:hypothetical protein